MYEGPFQLCSQTSNVMVVVWLSSANSSHLYFAAVPSTALGPLREIAFLQWQPTWLPMTACCDLQTNSFSTITTRQLQKAMGRQLPIAIEVVATPSHRTTVQGWLQPRHNCITSNMEHKGHSWAHIKCSDSHTASCDSQLSTWANPGCA